jgi:hypothetical protein
VHRTGLCDNQAESGLATSGTSPWPAGAGEGGDPDAASGGDEDEDGSAFSPDAVGVDAAAGAFAGAFASDGADLVEGPAEVSATLGGSGKSQGRGTNASGMILRTHMRICPSSAELE